MVRDGHTFDEACEMLTINHNVELTRPQLETLAAALPVRHRRRFEPLEALAEVATAEPPADELLETTERHERQRRLEEALERAIATLDPEDRLILNLRFQDGRKISDIATILGLPAKPLYARVERLKAELRTRIEAGAVDASALRDFVGTHE